MSWYEVLTILRNLRISLFIKICQNTPQLDIVKSFMKNRSGIYGKTRKTLPLEGGKV